MSSKSDIRNQKVTFGRNDFLRRGKMRHIFSSTILESFRLLAIVISIKSNRPMFQNRLALLYITSLQLKHYDDITRPSPVRKRDQSLFFKSIKIRTALVVCWSISRLPDWSFQSRLVIGFVDYVCFRLLDS